MGTVHLVYQGMTYSGPIIRFSHVYSDNCNCLIEEHSRTMAVIRLSCACKRTDSHKPSKLVLPMVLLSSLESKVALALLFFCNASQWSLKYVYQTLRPRPDDNTLLRKRTCIASFWPTVHTDPENAAPENTIFWKRVSGWRNPKMQPSRSHVDSESAYFPKRWPHRPALRRLITTTTTTMAAYMLVFVPQKILSLSFNLLAL